MKRKLLLLLLVSMTGVSFASETVKYRDIELPEAGGLAEALGADMLSIDSLVLKGKVGAQDFETMWRASYEGRLAVIDMSDAEVENKTVPDSAFYKEDIQQISKQKFNAVKLTQIILPDDIEVIGASAFQKAEYLQTVNIPKSTQMIGEQCFFDCWRLSSDVLILPEGLEEVSDGCFTHCSLSDVVLPLSMKRIGTMAFYGSSISKILIPDGVISIGSAAFNDTQSLHEIVFPEGCVFEGEATLTCSYVTKITLPSYLEEIPEDFANMCHCLKEVVMPDYLQTIRKGAFADCHNLSGITLNEGLELIEDYALKGVRLDCKLVLPSTLKTIGKEVFTNSRNVEKTYCAATIPPICHHDAFSSYYPFELPLYVPIGTADLYRNAEGWNAFSNIIETDEFPKSTVREIRTEGAASVIYDLNGRPINTEPRPGTIFIQKGKKYIRN